MSGPDISTIHTAVPDFDNQAENKQNGYFQSLAESLAAIVIVVDRNGCVKYLNRAAKQAVNTLPPLDERQYYEGLFQTGIPVLFQDDSSPAEKVFASGRTVTRLHEDVRSEEGRVRQRISASPVLNAHGEITDVMIVIEEAAVQTSGHADPIGTRHPSGAKQEEGGRKHHLIDEDSSDNEEREALLLMALQKHEELNNVLQEVEIAKEEWEGTLDCVGDIVILTDGQGKIIRCNRALIEFTGMAYEAVLDLHWKDLIPEDHIRIGAVLGQGMEFYHKPKGRWFIMKSYPFKNVTREGPGTVITLHDSTEVRQMTEELERKSQEIEKNRKKLECALDNISSLIQQVVKEKGLGIRFTNPNLIKCYEALECTHPDCTCFGKEAMRCWQVEGTFCRNQLQQSMNSKLSNCTDCPVYKEATSDPIYQIGEHFNNMMQILETKNGELEEAYRELKASQTTILQQEKMASIGQLAAGVAHEINNPMGFISSNLGTLDKYVGRLTGFIQTLSHCTASFIPPETAKEISEMRKKEKIDYITEDIKDLIEESLDGADRVRTIVQNLKSFSWVDQAENKETDINECIENTVNIVWNELKYKATLQKDYGELPLTKCYAQQLNQVFMNLLVNAAHAIDKQGEIVIRTWAEKETILISISDTGKGIPEKEMNRIFEPFFTTKDVGQGTGLGLSITYDIIKNHNGEIRVESEIGKGTTFTVMIPIIEGK